MDIYGLIKILKDAADDGCTDIHTVDPEIGVCELRVVKYSDGCYCIESTEYATDGEILGEEYGD